LFCRFCRADGVMPEAFLSFPALHMHPRFEWIPSLQEPTLSYVDRISWKYVYGPGHILQVLRIWRRSTSVQRSRLNFEAVWITPAKWLAVESGIGRFVFSVTWTPWTHSMPLTPLGRASRGGRCLSVSF
jgi:hypothetical protein